jgi:hypothetical protein
MSLDGCLMLSKLVKSKQIEHVQKNSTISLDAQTLQSFFFGKFKSELESSKQMVNQTILQFHYEFNYPPLNVF